MLILLCATTHRLAAEVRYFPPSDRAGSWRRLDSVRTIRAKVGIDTEKLDKAFDYVKTSTKNGGLLVARNGWLVYEKYFGKGHREATPNLGSCGKSVTSVAIGILMEQRPDLFPEGLDQNVFTPNYLPPEAFPLTDPRMKEIKLGQLLSMSAGIRGNNPVYVHGKAWMIHPAGPDGWQAMVDDIALGKHDGTNRGHRVTASTVWCEPGGGYSYATASVHLASMMLRHVAGKELDEFVAEHLAKPLGWGRWGFGYKSVRQITHTPGGGGIALRPTDMLRFGYLMLNEGNWHGQQLVPAAYVRHCSRKSPFNPHFPYSLQFRVNTDQEIQELPPDAYWKAGSGGHALYVVPSLDLVVWKLGGRDGQYSAKDTGLRLHRDVAAKATKRRGWKATVNQSEATTKTLQLVIASIADSTTIKTGHEINSNASSRFNQ